MCPQISGIIFNEMSSQLTEIRHLEKGNVKMTTIGFIGTGNMGSAIALAAAKSHKADRILLANRTREKAEKLAEEINGEVCDNKTIAREADYIFLAVKPQMLKEMYEQLDGVLAERKSHYVVVSLIAGRDLVQLSELLGNVPIIRVAPNMPAIVGSGISLYAANQLVSAEEKKVFEELMKYSGLVEETDEHTMVCANGVMGCGPAFAAMFVEALADGAVACGLPRNKAIRYAAEMLKGTADVLLMTDQHPGTLKDSVCSPAGSTIQGVRVLEESSFRAAVMNAVIATFEKKL